MNEKPDSAVPHPDELLAAYVDGTASAEDVQQAESHLADCASCRQDVQFARAGRAALSEVTEVEAPGIARNLARLLRESDRERDGELLQLEPRRRRGRVWEQVAWAAAVAAVVAGIIGAVVVISKNTTTRLSTGPAKAPAEATVAPTSVASTVINRGAVYSPDSLTALAKSLASESPVPTPAPPQSLLTPPEQRDTVSSGLNIALDASAATSCLRAGSGLGDDAVPIYLELATYQTTPAYVGAFRSDVGAPHLLVIVVSVDGCQPLFVVSQTL